MFTYIVPITLLASSIGAFLLFVDPTYKDIKELSIKSTQYEEALSNARKLKETRDELTNKYNAFSPSDLDKLKKILPDNVDNIKLILEIQRIAQTYGMDIQNIKFDTATIGDTKDANQVTQSSAANLASKKEYGIFEMQFTTTRASYASFVNFLRDMEKSLRVVDVGSISFTSNDTVGTNQSSNDLYKYDFKIKTYWLKN